MLSYLGEVQRLSPSQVAEHLATLLAERSAEPKAEPTRPTAEHAVQRQTLVEQVKEQIGDPYAFIASLVELSPTGRGSCPLHPPDNHPSFAVNKHTGQWTCFHEYTPPKGNTPGHYLSGDAINLYARLKGLTNREALFELWQYYNSC
jgi:hypothetical protein